MKRFLIIFYMLLLYCLFSPPSKLSCDSPGGHVPADTENGIHNAIEHQRNSVDLMPELEDGNLVKTKKLKENSSGYTDEITKWDSFPKRKQCLDDISPLKRIRMPGTNSGSQGEENGLSVTLSNTQFRCSFTRNNMKRMREDEVVVAAPCKKTR